MKTLKIILCLLGLFTCVDFFCQAGKDSIAPAVDSLKLPERDNIAARDSNAFKPQYQRGVMYMVKTNLGIVYTGFIVDETEYYITLADRRSSEKYEIRKGEIKSAKVFSDKQSYLSLVGENYHARNYMLASSAFLFERESINSTYHWFILENLDYAITENWAVNVNTLTFYPVSLGVKCAFKLEENSYIGGSIFGMGNVGSTDGNYFFGYGGIAKYTRGTSNDNFTLGGGVLGINSDALFSTPQPVPFYNFLFSNVSYCTRINEHVAMNFEGWYLPQAEIGFVGAGVKLVKNEDYSWTFGCYTILNLLNNSVSLNFKAFPIPYLGMSQKF